jgi:subtilisin family serine protease
MKKIYISILALCLAAGAQAQQEMEVLPRLSPGTHMLLKDMAASQGKLPDGYIHRDIKGTIYLSGVIKVIDISGAQSKLDALGVLVGTKAGNIWTVQVPYANVKAFTKTSGISYIQLDEPLRPAMSQARKTTRADSVHAGTGLPWPITGKGVVMGIIDFGFDYNHPGMYDTSGNTYRVKRVWELNTTGTPPAGYTYGHELATEAAIQAQGTDNIEQSHGTGVAGIASGSGFGTPFTRERGIAFDADMVFVGVRRDSIGEQWRTSSFSDFIDGINYVFNYGKSVNLPTVCNISWGSQSGPHDGTSLFNQACDNLSGQGRVIVMSAGNDGQEKIHLSKTFSGNDTLINTFVTFSSPTYKRTWVDVWGEKNKSICAQVTLYKNGVAGNTTGFICIDPANPHNPTYLIGDNGLDTCFIDFISSPAEFNDKPRMTLNIFNKAEDSIYVNISGKDGTVHAWNEYYYYGYKYGYSSAFESLNMPDAVTGNSDYTVSDMGSAKSVLLVGAYASKTAFTNLDKQNLTYTGYVQTGDIVPFSSRGPMADGRIKPDIAGPGLTLATAISSFDQRYVPGGLNKQQLVAKTDFKGKTYYYAEFTGTSASSPAAAGVAALMFQVNPKLTTDQLINIIKQTAIKDNFTGNLPADGNNTWGRGKINAYAAVKAALQANSVYEYKGRKLDCAVYPNPNNGEFTLLYTATKAETLGVQVYDIRGSLVSSASWSVNRGDNVYSISLPQLVKGTYIVNLKSPEGSMSMNTQVQ